MASQTDADQLLRALQLRVSAGAGLDCVCGLPGDRLGPGELHGDQTPGPHLELQPGPAQYEGHRLLVSGRGHREAADLEELVTRL